ncbi:hypothetical protein T484DRAFT_3430593 [Baffinella frigidus]|nr:hypothetical protein T484DRAFT_3430593 [Cryptophyta sp. CCMP2293]
MPGRVFSSRDSLQRTTTTRRTASLFVAANNNNTPDGIAEALGVPVEKLLALNQETFPGLNATSQFKAGTLLRVPPEVKATLPAGSKTATTQSDAKERGGRAGACSPGEKRGREGAGGAESCKTAKRGTPDGGASPGTSSAGGKTNSRSSLTSDSLERIDQHLAPKPIPKKGSTGTEVTEGTAVKRGRGRPRGRTSTKLSHRGEMGSTGTEVTEGIAVKRGRGRPRGRKSTNPQQKGSTGTEVTKGTAVKRKLGRPRGRTSTNPP